MSVSLKCGCYLTGVSHFILIRTHSLFYFSCTQFLLVDVVFTSFPCYNMVTVVTITVVRSLMLSMWSSCWLRAY
jgi:hypothetical protein